MTYLSSLWRGLGRRPKLSPAEVVDRATTAVATNPHSRETLEFFQNPEIAEIASTADWQTAMLEWGTLREPAAGLARVEAALGAVGRFKTFHWQNLPAVQKWERDEDFGEDLRMELDADVREELRGRA